MVPVLGNNSCSGASSWAGQCDSQPEVKINSKPLQLDVDFQAIQQQVVPLELDLFTSQLTALLPWYYSWRSDLEVEATDAFTQNWARSRGFANHPDV